MSVIIRSYNPQTMTDIDAVTEIYAYHVRHGTASFEHDGPSRDEMRARFDALVAKSYPILIAEAVGAGADDTPKILGYAYAGPHKGRKGYDGTVEDSVYIAPDALRKGIGKQLLSALIEQATVQGYQQMMAVIGDSANAPSIGLHTDCGFTLIGTAKGIGYKFGRYLDVTYMQRALQR